MRIPLLAAVLGFVLTAAIPAAAVPSARLTPELTAPTDKIVEVARRCKAGRHYVAAHRNKRGHHVRGHCVRDRR